MSIERRNELNSRIEYLEEQTQDLKQDLQTLEKRVKKLHKTMEAIIYHPDGNIANALAENFNKL